MFRLLFRIHGAGHAGSVVTLLKRHRSLIGREEEKHSDHYKYALHRSVDTLHAPQNQLGQGTTAAFSMKSL